MKVKLIKQSKAYVPKEGKRRKEFLRLDCIEYVYAIASSANFGMSEISDLIIGLRKIVSSKDMYNEIPQFDFEKQLWTLRFSSKNKDLSEQYEVDISIEGCNQQDLFQSELTGFRAEMIKQTVEYDRRDEGLWSTWYLTNMSVDNSFGDTIKKITDCCRLICSGFSFEIISLERNCKTGVWEFMLTSNRVMPILIDEQKTKEIEHTVLNEVSKDTFEREFNVYITKKAFHSGTYTFEFKFDSWIDEITKNLIIDDWVYNILGLSRATRFSLSKYSLQVDLYNQHYKEYKEEYHLKAGFLVMNDTKVIYQTGLPYRITDIEKEQIYVSTKLIQSSEQEENTNDEYDNSTFGFIEPLGEFVNLFED